MSVMNDENGLLMPFVIVPVALMTAIVILYCLSQRRCTISIGGRKPSILLQYQNPTSPPTEKTPLKSATDTVPKETRVNLSDSDSGKSVCPF